MMVLRVRDLDRFIRYLIDLGYTVSEGPHAILPDDSEVGCCRTDDRFKYL